MRNAETIAKLIDLYREEVKRLESFAKVDITIGEVTAWRSCKFGIADICAELQAGGFADVGRGGPGVERRRKPRRKTA